MVRPLQRARQIAAAQLAVCCGDLQLSYEQMWERCRRLVGALGALGIVQGDRVAVVGPNCHRYL